MDNKEFSQWLIQNEACKPSLTWIKETCYSYQEAWDICENGEWLYWLLKRSHAYSDVVEGLVTVSLAETIKDEVNEEYFNGALKVARLYYEGNVDKDCLTIVHRNFKQLLVDLIEEYDASTFDEIEEKSKRIDYAKIAKLFTSDLSESYPIEGEELPMAVFSQIVEVKTCYKFFSKEEKTKVEKELNLQFANIIRKMFPKAPPLNNSIIS